MRRQKPDMFERSTKPLTTFEKAPSQMSDRVPNKPLVLTSNLDKKLNVARAIWRRHV